MQARLARREGVVILAPRNIEHIAWPHHDLLPKRAARTFALLGRQAFPIVAWGVDRVLGAPLVEPPRLGALDVEGEDVHRVEMRVEAPAGLPGTIGVTGCRPPDHRSPHTKTAQ